MYMSLLGFDSAGSATINGLTEINANNVFSDVLYYDAGTVPVNVKTAIDAITVDVTALEADVATLQSEMNAVEADVATLQGEMNAVEADVATLQSDVTALTISTGITAATVAGLVISQAAQDVTIASHTVSIAALQLEDLSLDTRIDALEVKTTDQSWGSLTGTSFSTKVNVGGGSGVVLNTASASQFNSGIVCSSIASTSVTTNIDIGSALTTGDVNLGNSAAATGVALNWGGSSNSGQLSFTGGSFNLISSGVYTQRSGPSFNMTIADTQTSGILNLGTGTSRTGAINLGTGMTSGTITIGRSDATASTATTDINTGSAMTGAIRIGSGASAKPITIGSAASTNTINGTTTIAGTANINTTSLSNTSIGNGAAGGNFTVNAAANSITGTTNTLNSTGDTSINSNADIYLIADTAVNVSAVGIITIASSTSSALISGETGVELESANGNIIIDAGTNDKVIITAGTTIDLESETVLTHNFKIQQNAYTGMTETQLGYTDSATTFTDPMNNTLTARSNFSLASKGVWLIVCGYEWGANATNTIQNKEIILSTTSGGSTPAAYGLSYYEEIDDAAGITGSRQIDTIMGVFTATATTTIYVNARSQVNSGTNTELRTNVSWTRIG